MAATATPLPTVASFAVVGATRRSRLRTRRRRAAHRRHRHWHKWNIQFVIFLAILIL